MKVCILCGGSGSRLEDYSLPKPLNMIFGRPSIYYCLQKLPPEINTLYFIIAPHLQKYNIEEIIINQFKTKKCVFFTIPYFTRGPVETAWLGTKSIAEDDEPIVFVDNDVIYNFPYNFSHLKGTSFLGYSIDNTASEAFSFLQLDGDVVIDFKEKKRISDKFCCGVYGFSSIQEFRKYALIRMKIISNAELYMSSLFQLMLSDGVLIKGIRFDGEIRHIGSLNELHESVHCIDAPCMRVCFDLDNTLVTYPTIPGDYSTVKPILQMISLAQQLKSEGHTIIIHTARRMLTHKHNTGAVIKDIGRITFDTLDNLCIPYDELIFGKPIADIYIDDRSVNPYRNNISSMGYLIHEEKGVPLNMLPPNKYNTIELQGNKIIKKGPTAFLSGEIFYYMNIPTNLGIYSYFPKYISSTTHGPYSQLVIENIPSIPFYTLFKSELIMQEHVLIIFEAIDILHNTKSVINTDILFNDMKLNYIQKLEERFKVTENYPFIDASEVQMLCLNGLKDYIPQWADFIHGDLWFSNILVNYRNEIKLIDMKGQLNGKYTTGGDKLYDYGKLLQSFLGYDTVLYNDDAISDVYRKNMLELFYRETDKRNISRVDLQIVTFSLVIGTLHSIQNLAAKQRIWEWIKNMFVNV